MKTNLSIAAYLGCIVTGNLLAAHFGPWVTPIVGFFAIGFDLSMRDVLHKQWQERGVLKRNMALLILSGSLLTVLVNSNAWRIALASTVAFGIEASVSTLVYWLLFKRPRLFKMNVANFFGGACDSLLFPTIAFGAFLPAVILMQWSAKFSGGFLWALLLTRKKEDLLLPCSSCGAPATGLTWC